MTKQQVEALTAELREEVKSIAEDAASWVFDGNTEEETYARILAGIEDGDPEVLDALTGVDWSMQWADGANWQALFAEALPAEVDDESQAAIDLSDELFIEVAQDYGNEVFFASVEKQAREHLEES